jgi:EAL domain-containing protein (putative c-di-GMP-specific phosphodiesterase class I)/GGDEF domain-containing protein
MDGMTDQTQIGAERRASTRVASSQLAELHLDGGFFWSVVIADFSETGMFLSFEKGLLPDQHMQLIDLGKAPFSIVFVDDSGAGAQGANQAKYYVRAQIAHLTETAAGIRYVGRHHQTVNALMQITENSRGAGLSDANKRHLAYCIEMMSQKTSKMLQAMLPNAMADLKQSVVMAPSDQVANARMTIANRVETAADRIVGNYQNALRHPPKIEQTETAMPNSLESLSVVDKGAFEDWLVSRVLITKLDTHYLSQLLPLKMRLKSMGLSEQETVQNPLGPSRIVHAFREVIHPLIQDIPLEKRMFRLFETDVMMHLEKLFQDINSYLEEQGIRPALDAKPLGNSKENGHPKQPEEKTDATDSVASSTDSLTKDPNTSSDHDNSDGTSAEVPLAAKSAEVAFSYGAGLPIEPNAAEHRNLSALDPKFQTPNSPPDMATKRDDFLRSHETAKNAYQSVLSLVKTLQAGRVNEAQSPSGEAYSSQEVDASLSTMQHSEQNIDELEKHSLLERVLAGLAAQGDTEKALKDGQKIAIDVVDRFFVSLKDNPRLTAQAKQHLKQLELPVLRQTLKDDSFFNEEANGLKEVMNRVARLGIRGGRLGRIEQQKLEAVVSRVNQEYNDNPSIIEEAKSELDSLLVRQHELYVRNVERVAAAAEGVHRVEQAKTYVANELNRRLSGKETPEALSILLDEGWIKYLNLICVRQGANSDAWHEAVEVVEQLLAYSDNPREKVDAARLLASIQDGLRFVSANAEASDKACTALKQLFKDAPLDRHKKNVTKLSELEQSKEQLNLRKSKALKEWIKRCKAIPINTWLNLHKAGDDVKHIRLVWIAKGYSKFVFVNHQGMRVIELGLFKLAEYLKSGEITIDPDYDLPVVNQSLEHMVQDVYEKLAFDSSHDAQTKLVNQAEFLRLIKRAMHAGKRTDSCVILYIRLFCEAVDVRSERLASFIKKLKVSSDDGSIVARINEFDFALYCGGNETKQTIAAWQAYLSSLESEQKQRPECERVNYIRSVNWGYQGFDNAEKMLSAVQATLDLPAPTGVDRDAYVDRSDNSDIPEKMREASLDISTETTEKLEPFVESEIDNLETITSKQFEVFRQFAKQLNKETKVPEQFELLCSEVGTGRSFQPTEVKHCIAMDQWWLTFVTKQINLHSDVWHELDTLRVPLSGHAFQDDNLKVQLTELCALHALPPERFWFDIYEGCAIENIDLATDIIRELQTLGFKVTLSNFGTDRAPFALLRALPIDMIIIDEGYVNNLNDDAADESEAGSIVEVAHFFGKLVLATSVDTAICLQKMRKLSVDFVQGTSVADYERIS